MMHKLLPVMLLMCLTAHINAQEATKLDLRMWEKLKKGEVHEKYVPLLVKGDQAKIKQLTLHAGGIYKMGYNNISSVEIPTEKVTAFAASTAVLKIENTSAKGTLLMDTARIRNNIDSAQQGYAPLDSGYTGKGVIIGIIDGGIYWQHGDFRNPLDSSTRIRYIWDQVATGANAPAPYGYGNQWSWIDIDNGNCTHVPPSNDFGHGTCVAGIAAGNSLSTKGTPYEGQMTGVAPQADIIAVRVDNNNFLSNVADAVDYIFKKADALGMPCVINTSIGTYYGSHDGDDLATHMMEALLDQSPGRVLVAAAGNAGNIPHHLSYAIPQDSAYTFFKYNSTYQEVYFDFWADTANFSNAYFSIGCNDALGSDLGRLDYLNVLNDFNPPQGTGIVITRNLTNGATLLGEVNMQATLDGSRYHVEFDVLNISDPTNLWRLQTSGSGTFDLWSSSSLIGSADMTSYLQNVLIQYPNYRHPDSLKTMVSSWQCSDKVITVGNYSSRAGYLDRDSNYVNLTVSPYSEVVGKRFATSSFGPTRDNRLKPDIMATGSTTICTGDAGFIALATSPSNRVKVSITQKHIRNGGTSMASPIVAGAAALYLEQHPTATYQEVKDVMIWTAKKDAFTGPTDNNEYGHGKINVYQMLIYSEAVYGPMDTACLYYNPLANVDTGNCVGKVYGSMDTACLNYNPHANVNGGTCTLKVYGCTDPAATNYDSTANVDNNTCQYPNVSVNDIVSGNIRISVVPNPFSNQTTFSVVNTGNAYQTGEIQIIDQLGSLIDVIHVTNGVANYTYLNNKLSAGVYYYRVVLDTKAIATGKLLVQ
jgi:subtilisin family serine protease